MENYNLSLKGNDNMPPKIQVNIPLHKFLEEEFPKLLKIDYRERTEATVTSPSLTHIPRCDQILLSLMSREADVLKTPDGSWYTNRPNQFGTPLTQACLVQYRNALNGKDSYFHKPSEEFDFKDHAELLHGICRITECPDGSFLGDCCDCHKNLYCVGTILVTDMEGKLNPPLTTLLSSPSGKHRVSSYDKSAVRLA